MIYILYCHEIKHTRIIVICETNTFIGSTDQNLKI